MKRTRIPGLFKLMRSLFLAMALLLTLLAVIPAKPAQAQSVAIIISPECCGTGAIVWESWSQTFTASGGAVPYTFSTTENVPGLAFQTTGNDGVLLSGTPTQAGSFNISIKATDKNKESTTISGTLVVEKQLPVISISAVITGHPDAASYMVKIPITVKVSFSGTPLADPTAKITVSGGTNPGAPTCLVTIDAVNTGECDLVYTTAGVNYDISASYPGDVNYQAAAAQYSGNPISVQAFSVAPMLSAGTTHTCFLSANGNFSCWGRDDWYEVDSSGIPVIYGPVISISAGSHHTCMIKSDLTVACWGDNPDIKTYPNQAKRKFVSISSGGDFACALDKAGALWCWGSLPANVLAYQKGPYKSVSAGDEHVCALNLGNSSPVCWGSNTSGQSTPPTPGLTGLKAISAGYSHTCAITSANGLACWGGIEAAPPSGTSFTSLGSGSGYSCARKSDQKLVCWGNVGSPSIDTATAFNGFASGFLYTCGWIQHSPKNYLSCWGANNYLQAPRLELSPAVFSAGENIIPLGDTWSQAYTTQGGFLPHTLTFESGLPNPLPDTALSGKTVTWTPDSLGTFSYALTLSENDAGSGLPLELTPVRQSYSLLVQSPDTTTEANLSGDTVNAGSPVHVTVQVSKNASPNLSGTITISGQDGTRMNTCQSQVSASGTASCSLYFAYSGVKSISAAYSGNHFYHSSASTPLNITVNPISITPVVSAGNQFTCSLDSAGIPTCWGKSDASQTTPLESVYNQISAGDAFACGHSLNASLYCWGWDGYGLDHPVSGVNYGKVASGSMHACGLTVDGMTISCWGNSLDGRTSAPADGSTYTDISAGDSHTCALKSDGTLSCWGVNTYGQTTVTASNFSSISAGGTFTCGILSGGTLACWGGSGVADSIRTVPEGIYLSVDAGYSHACAVRSDHRVICWGDNSNGKASPPAHTFVSVSAGYDHTCAIREKSAGLENNVLECWGSNAMGQAPSISFLPASLATIDVGAAASIPISASGARTGQFVYALAAGSELPAGLQIDSHTGLVDGVPVNAGEYDFVIRVLEDGRTPALMAEKSYHLTIRSSVSVEIDAISPADRMVGDPITLTIRVSETPVGHFALSPTGVITVQSTDGKTCQATLTSSGTASTGSCTIFFTTAGLKTITASYPGNAYFLEGSTAAGQEITVAPFSQAPKVHTSDTRTFVHFADGSAMCIGLNCYTGGLTGTLTDLDISSVLACGLDLEGQVRCREAIVPLTEKTAVAENGPYVELAVGVNHACGLRIDGTVFCWGDDTAGKASPPPGIFTAVSAGASQTCGVRANGTLDCWGSGSPVPDGQYKSVSVGAGHACAVRADGAVACWGDNTDGQTDAPAEHNFQAVSVGASHSCALDTDGHIVCWGKNDMGQSTAPYGAFTSLASSTDHNCALRGGLSLTCWGGDQYSEAPQIHVSTLAESELVVGRNWEFAFSPSGGTRPYNGSVSEGELPKGINLGVNLSPAGVILYGTPEIPDDYRFTVKWEDNSTPARPISLSLEKPYWLKTTGGDLAVGITAVGPVAMVANQFSFVYTFRNLSALPVPSVQVVIQVPTGLTDIIYSGIEGCKLEGEALRCPLASLKPGVNPVLTVTGKVTAKAGDHLSTRAEIQPLLENYPEISQANNTSELTILVDYQAAVFDDQFTAESPSDEWTGGSILTAPSGITYLGNSGGGSSLRLVVADLAPHRWVEVSFDLFVIGPWAGNNRLDPSSPSLWSFGETGKSSLLNTTFCNEVDCLQAFPGIYPHSAFPAWTEAAALNQLGFSGLTDSQYHIKMRFDHTASLLDLSFVAGLLPNGASWGMDNVHVTIGSGISLVYMPAVRK